MKTPVFEVYQDRKKQWRWRLLAKNGKIVADSSESYTRMSDAVRAAATVKKAVRELVLIYPVDADVTNARAWI